MCGERLTTDDAFETARILALARQSDELDAGAMEPDILKKSAHHAVAAAMGEMAVRLDILATEHQQIRLDRATHGALSRLSRGPRSTDPGV